MFIENDAERFRHLQQELAQIALPSKVKVATYDVDFEQALTEILDTTEGHLAPAFVMIDPFGWTGFPFSLIERIGQEQRSEVLVSFMVESINRWIEHPQQRENWSALFGDDSWHAVPKNGLPAERRDFLVSLYQQRLKDAHFTHQWKFEIRDEGNRPEYYLVFGSQSIDGLELMKEAMWKAAPDGSFRYSDYRQGSGQMGLFGDPDPTVLAELLLQRFRGEGEQYRPVSLRQFTLVETEFVGRHLTAALRELEGSGKVVIRRPDGRTRRYFDKVWVRFS